MVKFKADGNTGRVAIYTGTNDAPLNNPLGNLSRVLFHSDLDYPVIISTRTGSVTFPSRGNVSNVTAAHNLFAHGRPGIPLVFGRITNISGTPPLVGSVPVNWNSYGFGRFATLGANATHVIMHEQIACGFISPNIDTVGFNGQSNFGSITLNYEVYITDTILE